MPKRSAIPASDSPTKASCSAASRSNVRQRIHFGLPPSPFSMPGSHPSRARSLSARLVARPPASSRAPIAEPTGKDAAAVEDRHAAPAADSRANEPGARTAEVARRADDAHGILFVLQFLAAAAMPVDQDHAVVL